MAKSNGIFGFALIAGLGALMAGLFKGGGAGATPAAPPPAPPGAPLTDDGSGGPGNETRPPSSGSPSEPPVQSPEPLPYPCTIITWVTPTEGRYDGASFATSIERAIHYRDVHKQDIWICPVGDEYFYSEYNLAAHMRFQHPDLVYTDPAYEKYRTQGFEYNG